MDSYDFWADFFDTYQSLPDWLKLAWLMVPPAFVLGAIALALRFRIEREHLARPAGGRLLCTIEKDEFDRLVVYGHDRELERELLALFTEEKSTGRLEPPMDGWRR